MIEARHTVGFLRLAAIELHRIAEDHKAAGGHAALHQVLSNIADKADAEAEDLDAALAPKEKME